MLRQHKRYNYYKTIKVDFWKTELRSPNNIVTIQAREHNNEYVIILNKLKRIF